MMQVHADASNFADGVTKQDAYEQVLMQAEGLFIGQRNWQPQLILGPFHGKVACQTIQFGKGVCGTAAQTGTTQLVRDVESFPGHIACDGDSKSEIVVPILVEQPGGDGEKKVVAIIDIDCAVLDGFDDVDKAHLEDLAALLAKSCDW
ncbi:Free methionine-R-sulfoxide reductase [Ilyonectria robusta]